MFAGEMNPAIARFTRQQAAQTNKGPCSARPLILHPAFRRAAFEVFIEAFEDSFQLLQRCINALAFFKAGDSLRFARPRISHQDTSWSRLTPGRLPDLNCTFRKRKTVQALVFPKTIPGLEVDARDRIVASVFNNVLFAC